MSDSLKELKTASQRKASFLQTMQAVFWSFFGVRKSQSHADDMAKLNPVHVIIAGLLGAFLFIVTLILIVKSVVK